MADDSAVISPDTDIPLPLGQPNAPLTIRPDGKPAAIKESAPDPLPAPSSDNGEAPALDLPWEASPQKHKAESTPVGPAGALTSGDPSVADDTTTPPSLDLPWQATPQQAGLPQLDSISSADNPPPGSRYAAARANLQKMADQYLIGPSSASNEWSTGITHAADTALLNIPRKAAAAINAWRYGTSFSEEDALLRDEDAALERQNPKSAIAGDVAGIGIGAAALPMIGPQAGASRVAARLAESGPGLAARMGYGALNSGLYSGAGSLVNSNFQDPVGAAKSAVIGAGAGALLTPVAEHLVGAASRFWKGNTSPVDEFGRLVPSAIDAATKAGIHPDDIPALAPYLEQAFKNKGISVPAAKEAQLAEFNMPITRGQATANPREIYREGQLPEASPYGSLKHEQTSAVDNSASGIIDSSHETPTDAMSAVADELQGRATSERANIDNSYTQAYAHPGVFHRSAFTNLGRSLRRSVSNDGYVVNSDTPNASSALDVLDNLGHMSIPDRLTRTPPNHQIVGVNLKGVDTARKQLVGLQQAARGSGNKTDAAIVGRLIDHFDNHVANAYRSGQFTGDAVRASRDMDAARAAFSSYKSRFGPRGKGDDAGLLIENVVHDRKNAQELASKLYNQSQLGSTGIGARLYDRLEQALGRGSSGMRQVNEALKMKLLTPVNKHGQGLIGVITDKDTSNALEVAKRINNFINNNGRLLAHRAFSPDEIGEFRRLAGALNILGQQGKAGSAEKARNVALGLAKSLKIVGPLLAGGASMLHGSAGELVGSMLLHPVLAAGEKLAEKMHTNALVRKATSGAPRLQRISPTFPVVMPHRATPGINRNDQ